MHQHARINEPVRRTSAKAMPVKDAGNEMIEKCSPANIAEPKSSLAGRQRYLSQYCTNRERSGHRRARQNTIIPTASGRYRSCSGSSPEEIAAPCCDTQNSPARDQRLAARPPISKNPLVLSCAQVAASGSSQTCRRHQECRPCSKKNRPPAKGRSPDQRYQGQWRSDHHRRIGPEHRPGMRAHHAHNLPIAMGAGHQRSVIDITVL